MRIASVAPHATHVRALVEHLQLGVRLVQSDGCNEPTEATANDDRVSRFTWQVGYASNGIELAMCGPSRILAHRRQRVAEGGHGSVAVDDVPLVDELRLERRVDCRDAVEHLKEILWQRPAHDARIGRDGEGASENLRKLLEGDRVGADASVHLLERLRVGGRPRARTKDDWDDEAAHREARLGTHRSAKVMGRGGGRGGDRGR